MKSISAIFTLNLLFAVLTGCGSADTPEPTREKFSLIDSPSLKLFDYSQNETTTQTSLRLKAETTLMNNRDSLHVELRAQLLEADSKLALNAYTTSLTTNDGIRLEMTSVDNSLEVHLFTRDYPTFHFCTIPNALATNGVFHIRIQLSHPRSSSPTILIWNIYNDGKNKNKKNFTYLDSSNSDCNSQNRVFIDHFGSGRLWGLELEHARLQDVRRSGATL